MFSKRLVLARGKDLTTQLLLSTTTTATSTHGIVVASSSSFQQQQQYVIRRHTHSQSNYNPLTRQYKRSTSTATSTATTSTATATTTENRPATPTPTQRQRQPKHHYHEKEVDRLLKQVNALKESHSYEEAMTVLNNAHSQHQRQPEEARNKMKHNSITATILTTRGELLALRNQNKKSIVAFNEALTLLQTIHGGENHVAVAVVCHQLGIVHFNSDKVDTAIDFFEQALRIRKQLQHDNHKDVASVWIALGNCYVDQCRYEDAMSSFEKAVSVYQVNNVADVELAGVYFDMANVHVFQNNEESALNLFTQVLALQQQQQQQGMRQANADIADTYLKIGNVLLSMNDHNKALESYEQAMQLRTKHFGENSDEVAEVLTHLAALYNQQQQVETAIEKYSRALTMYLSLHGETNANVADIYTNLGNMLTTTKREKEALFLYQKAITILTTIHESDRHPDIADIIVAIADMYQQQQQTTLALEQYKKALEMQEAVFGHFSLQVMKILDGMANTHYGDGNTEEAYVLFNEALRVLEHIYGTKHSHFIDYDNTIKELMKEAMQAESETEQ